jgi:hypothetical protein
MIHAAAAAPTEALQVTVVPVQPLLERTLYGQAMNCDFRIANQGSQALELRVVQLVVRDPTGAVIVKLEVNDKVRPGTGQHAGARRRHEPGFR